ncbi:MAG TPA: hypothetical protein VFR34_07265, partial [Paracoccaceae bacterium]|nr:hypothetical protein [Paracoccaceae bacterium]
GRSDDGPAWTEAPPQRPHHRRHPHAAPANLLAADENDPHFGDAIALARKAGMARALARQSEDGALAPPPPLRPAAREIEAAPALPGTAPATRPIAPTAPLAITRGPGEDRARGRSAAFSSGVALAFLLVVLLLGLYVLRVPIGSALPGLAPALARYAELVDGLRLALQSISAELATLAGLG